MNPDLLKQKADDLETLPKKYEESIAKLSIYEKDLKIASEKLSEMKSNTEYELDKLNELKCRYNSTKIKTDSAEANLQMKIYESNSLIDGY